MPKILAWTGLEIYAHLLYTNKLNNFQLSERTQVHERPCFKYDMITVGWHGVDLYPQQGQQGGS